MTVERRAGLTRKEFVEEFVAPNRPVILTDLQSFWPDLRNCGPEFFRQHYGDCTGDIRGEGRRLADLLEQLESGRADRHCYPCKINLRQPEFRALAARVAERPALIRPDRSTSHWIPRRLLAGLYDLEIFFGGPGGEFPYLHYDFLGLYAIINQIHGEKEFTLFSPEQQRYLYPKPGQPWVSEIENHHEPDLDRYPLFRHAEPQQVTLHPGESLFIPQRWYHTARSLNLTVSLAMDQLCHFNWEHFVGECLLSRRHKKLKSGLLEAYLNGLGRALYLRERLAGEP